MFGGWGNGPAGPGGYANHPHYMQQPQSSSSFHPFGGGLDSSAANQQKTARRLTDTGKGG